MSLDYDTSKVNRDAWPDGGIPLFEFCVMMMICGVGHLKTDEDVKRLTKRALVVDALKNFDWRARNKAADEKDMIDLIPLMKGIRTNVGNETFAWFAKRLKEWELS
jgi:hypothetical protein